MQPTIFNTPKFLAVFVAAISLISCQSAGKLTIATESTPENLVFVLSAWSDQTPGNLQEVSVYRCVERGADFPDIGERVWSAHVMPDRESPLVGRFIYGREFSGLTTTHGPERLGAGCYVARAYAKFPDTRSAVTIFKISPEGKVRSGNA